MKTFLRALCAMFLFIGLNACDSDLIWDYAPIVLDLEVVNAQGQDLLDSTVVGNINGQKITATFQGKTYQRDVNVSSRAYFAVFRGLITHKASSGYTLRFGELSGEETFNNEKLVIDWGDGKKDVITIYNRLVKEGKIKRRFYLNGKEQDSSTFIFQK